MIRQLNAAVLQELLNLYTVFARYSSLPGHEEALETRPLGMHVPHGSARVSDSADAGTWGERLACNPRPAREKQFLCLFIVVPTSCGMRVSTFELLCPAKRQRSPGARGRLPT